MGGRVSRARKMKTLPIECGYLWTVDYCGVLPNTWFNFQLEVKVHALNSRIFNVVCGHLWFTVLDQTINE